MRVMPVAAMILAAATAAPAQEAPQAGAGARQVVGLFLQTCVRFAGDVPGLRARLAELRLPSLRPEALAALRRGDAGVGYDATNRSARLALVSEDDGLCSAFAGEADGEETTATFESAVRRSGGEFRAEGEDGAARTATGRSWRYGLTVRGRDYLVVISADTRPGDVQAILSLSPRP